MHVICKIYKCLTKVVDVLGYCSDSLKRGARCTELVGEKKRSPAMVRRLSQKNIEHASTSPPALTDRRIEFDTAASKKSSPVFQIAFIAGA